MAETIKLSKQQQRLLGLVYKFRFITIPSIAKVLNIRNDSTHEAIKPLVNQGLLVRVYNQSWRIDRRPAYFYLSKLGVTTVRKLLDLPDKAVNTIYNDYKASPDFISECLANLECYISVKKTLPENSVIRMRTELNRFNLFPKHKPDMYISTSQGKETIIFVVPDKLPYFVNKRLDEYFEYSEEEGWNGKFPTMGFVLKDKRSKLGFLYKTQQKLESMGYDEDEIEILATDTTSLLLGTNPGWSSAISPTKFTEII